MPPLNPSASSIVATAAVATPLPLATNAGGGDNGVLRKRRGRRGSASSSSSSSSALSSADGGVTTTTILNCGNNDVGNGRNKNVVVDDVADQRRRRQRRDEDDGGRLHRIGVALSGPSRAVAPVAIIGGTFTVYSSAIRTSNNDALTPSSIAYLILLALNYAIVPRLSRRYVHPGTNKRSVALAEEAVKMGLGMGGWIISSYATAASDGVVGGDASYGPESSSSSSGRGGGPLVAATLDVMSRRLQHWSPLSTLVAAGLPSALYALQGTLTYVAYQNLDAVTYNGLTQLKVLSSALCCYVVLGKRQGPMQMLALGLLMSSVAIFQGSWRDWFGVGNGGGGAAATTMKKADNDDERKAVEGTAAASVAEGGGVADDVRRRRRQRLVSGVLPCLAATLLSGLAGAFSQRSLQTQAAGTMHRDACFYTIEISFLSAVCLVISMGAEWYGKRRGGRSSETTTTPVVARDGGQSTTTTTHFFAHWTYSTLLPVTTRATAGLLTALVHRHLGSVIKGFALVLGLVFSALLQFALEGVDLTTGQLAGTALVLLSSWLHFTHSVD